MQKVPEDNKRAEKNISPEPKQQVAARFAGLDVDEKQKNLVLMTLRAHR
jgi:hypothetical protein